MKCPKCGSQMLPVVKDNYCVASTLKMVRGVMVV